MIRLPEDHYTPGRESVAIIGTGIAGLVCAHKLHREFNLTIFEANDYIGGHTHTVDVEWAGEQHAIDTGFIVFNEHNYPNFTALLDELGVDSQPSDMSFSVKCDRTGLEYNGTSLNTLFAQRSNLFRPRFYGMISDILRFGREAPRLLRSNDFTTTVETYVRDHGYTDAFVEHYLVPIGSSIWSCPAEAFRAFPIRFVVEFFHNHMMLQVADRPQWRVVRGGSRQYVELIIRPFQDRIRLNTPVTRVRRLPEGVLVVTGRDEAEVFDHVIFACHSNQALALLDDPSPLERDVLRAMPYQPNEVTLHTDTSVLPRRKRAWAAWNYHLHADADVAVPITYNTNILQSLRSKHTFCVTLNGADHIKRDTVIDRFEYDHPVYTVEGVRARRMHEHLICNNQTSFCGAYWGYGFHEDGVNSALAVCAQLQPSGALV